ncbi:hypothetical protein C6A85_08480, partial [Mycobacterium sp. ITM-2017-0098]
RLPADQHVARLHQQHRHRQAERESTDLQRDRQRQRPEEPGAGLLGPLALTVALEVSGLSFGLSVPMLLVQAGYMLIGWQA